MLEVCIPLQRRVHIRRDMLTLHLLIRPLSVSAIGDRLLPNAGPRSVHFNLPGVFIRIGWDNTSELIGHFIRSAKYLESSFIVQRSFMPGRSNIML